MSRHCSEKNTASLYKTDGVWSVVRTSINPVEPRYFVLYFAHISPFSYWTSSWVQCDCGNGKVGTTGD